jgi:signal peptidase II
MARSGSARWFWLSLLVLAADRVTKLAIEAYTPKSFRRVVVPGLITLVHSHNPGIAFGLFANAGSKWFTALLVASSACVIALLAWLLASDRAGGPKGQAGLALILGGATGNLIDRLLRGSVTDFFEVRLGSYHWPAFNVADSAITIGAALVVLELLFARRHPTGEKVE